MALTLMLEERGDETQTLSCRGIVLLVIFALLCAELPAMSVLSRFNYLAHKVL